MIHHHQGPSKSHSPHVVTRTGHSLEDRHHPSRQSKRTSLLTSPRRSPRATPPKQTSLLSPWLPASARFARVTKAIPASLIRSQPCGRHTFSFFKLCVQLCMPSRRCSATVLIIRSTEQGAPPSSRRPPTPHPGTGPTCLALRVLRMCGWPFERACMHVAGAGEGH